MSAVPASIRSEASGTMPTGYLMPMKRPAVYRVAQALSAIVWAGLGILLPRYVLANPPWLDPRTISIIVISPVFGFVVSSPLYQPFRRDFMMFKLIAYPLVQLYIGIVLLGAAVGISVVGISIVRAGADQWIIAPTRFVEAAAWTVGLVSNSRWILALWLLAVINHIGLFVIQGKQRDGIEGASHFA